jgi:hypothetical protein
MIKFIKHFLLVVLFLVPPFCVFGSITDIRITNVGSGQFSVSWTSDVEELGYIRYGKQKDNATIWSIGNDDRGQVISSTVHHVTIQGLQSNTTYFYEIVSGDNNYDNANNYYTQKTGPYLEPVLNACQPAGRIFKNFEKTELAYNTIVYITILGENEQKENSSSVSVIVTHKTSGYWFIDLANFRTKDLQNSYSIQCGEDLILVEAQAGKDGIAKMKTLAVDAGPERPDMILKQREESYSLTNIIKVLQVLADISINVTTEEIDINKDGVININDVLHGFSCVFY